MAKCPDCGKEMLKAKGCIFDKIKISGKWYDRLSFVAEEDGERCHDCGAMDGGFHHDGCDDERSPIDGSSQLLMTDGVEAIGNTKAKTMIKFEMI